MAADEEWGSVVYDADSGESEDIVQVLSRARLFDTLTTDELWKLAPIIHHRFYFPRCSAPG